MSEVAGSHEPYDFEAIVAKDKTSVDRLPRLQHLDAVFEEARSWQMEHGNQVFACYQDASRDMSRIVNYLDGAAHAKQLLGQMVILQGEGIEVPRSSFNEVSGQFSMEPMPIEQLPEAAVMKAAVDGTAGRFMGFGYKLIIQPFAGSSGSESEAMVEDGESIHYRGVLLYQVGMETVSHTHGHTQLYVTGGVLSTQLEFQEDRRKQELGVITERLLEVESEEVAGQINQLTILLANDMALGDKLVEVVALMSDIAGSSDFKDSQANSDHLIDLFTYYINLQGVYTISSPDALRMVKGKRHTYARVDGAPLTLENRHIEDIILETAYRRVEGVFVPQKDRRVPYIVLEEAGKILHIPMDRLLDFKVN